MGSVNDALGGGAEFSYGDKVYTVSPCTYEVQAAFEKYMERQAVDACYAMKKYVSPEEFRELLNDTKREIASKHYSFGGVAVRKALEAGPHLEYMVFLLLKKNHPEVTQELVKQMMKDEGERLMEACGQANADPNAPSSK